MANSLEDPHLVESSKVNMFSNPLFVPSGTSNPFLLSLFEGSSLQQKSQNERDSNKIFECSTNNSLPISTSTTAATEASLEESSRSKSNSFSTQRSSIFSNQNDLDMIENSPPNKNSCSTLPLLENQIKQGAPLPQSEKEGSILNGFLDLVNKASSFWVKKFNKSEEQNTLQESPITDTENIKEMMKYKPLQGVHYLSEDKFLPLNEREELDLCMETQNLSLVSPDESSRGLSDKEENSMASTNLKKKSDRAHKSSFWNSKQDRLLLKYAFEMNSNWKKISKQFNHPNITTKFLKDRYKAIKDSFPSRKTRFSHKEDQIIVKYYKQYGTNWDSIAKHLPDRTPSMIKNRFYSSIKKKNLIETLFREINEEENPLQNNNENHQLVEQPGTIDSMFTQEYSADLFLSHETDTQNKYENEVENHLNPSIISEFKPTWASIPFPFDYHFENELQYRISDHQDHAQKEKYSSFENIDLLHCSRIESFHFERDEEETDFTINRFLRHDNFLDSTFYTNPLLQNECNGKFNNHTFEQGISGFNNDYTNEPDYNTSNDSRNNIMSYPYNFTNLELKRESSDPQTRQKIDLLKDRISSIQMMFYETKLELEKLQTNFKVGN